MSKLLQICAKAERVCRMILNSTGCIRFTAVCCLCIDSGWAWTFWLGISQETLHGLEAAPIAPPPMTCAAFSHCLTFFPLEFLRQIFTTGFRQWNLTDQDFGVGVWSPFNPIPTGGGGAHCPPPPPRYTSSNMSRLPWATDLKLSDNLNEIIFKTKIYFSTASVHPWLP